ncbi:YhcH/YjgK/YiaL family protein [Pontibacter ummariensis]|uniref:YhcH/YjgK/YiaL family protein n=1 Tax=Pontibacter ummariensis TaxID=1610492 RepID=A0A239C8S5_9BACT|nr:YhcH/YjgK/YiaL family protein [Pontibacter ummariensis]PRY15408.1 YhcH/YjgK/YiaL family protein [Pontibacter ummariensis]SNS16058.1 YhcH/YjgK/YiaL family protein [Pontibacter ummariensis]
MIVDKLSNAPRYFSLHPLFEQAFRFLQDADLTALPIGKQAIVGKELFAIISDGIGIPEQDAKLEVHRKYIDIQYIVSGTDRMGWKDLAQCGAPSEPYQEERDAAFFPDKTRSWFDVPAGSFTVFYPDDAHAAMVTEDKVRKIVLKIAVE